MFAWIKKLISRVTGHIVYTAMLVMMLGWPQIFGWVLLWPPLETMFAWIAWVAAVVWFWRSYFR